MIRLRAEGLSWTSADHEVIALDLRSSMYLATNATGQQLWQMLDSGTTHAALVQRLVDDYGVARDAAGADVDVFLEQLRSRELLSEDG